MANVGTSEVPSDQRSTRHLASDVVLSRRCQSCEQQFDIVDAEEAAWTTCPSCRARERVEATGDERTRPADWVPPGGYFG
jgi:hypothetical protein